MPFDKSQNLKYYPIGKAPKDGTLIIIKLGGKFAYEFTAFWNGEEWETPYKTHPIAQPTCWRYK